MSFHSFWREEEEHVTAANSKQAECPTHTKIVHSFLKFTVNKAHHHALLSCWIGMSLDLTILLLLCTTAAYFSTW